MSFHINLTFIILLTPMHHSFIATLGGGNVIFFNIEYYILCNNYTKCNNIAFIFTKRSQNMLEIPVRGQMYHTYLMLTYFSDIFNKTY